MHSLQLLGVPKLAKQGQNITIPLDKPASMLYYVAQRADWVSRSELGFLYRPDAPEQIALSNVRNYIHRAKNYPWANTLEVSKSRIRYQINTDVQAFNKAFKETNWRQALKLYKGTFLEGLNLQDAPSFETWLELERQDLSQKWRLAALNHAQNLEQEQEFASAEQWLERVLKLDPLDEEVMQVYLRVLFASGKRPQALDSYAGFCESLKQELNVEPLEATKTLVASLSKNEPESSDASTLKPKRKHNLPAQTTRFIGRKRELEHLTKTLNKDDCRLLSLVGGGIGKTRLSLELASTQLATYRQGVYFVPLVGVNSADLIASSIASNIGLSFAGKDDPKEQVIKFLAEKELLLVLDNFEHLVEGAALLGELLERAPNLNIVVTSRIALELKGEWLVDLTGLSYPPENTKEAPESFDAVKLFNNRAERLSASFVPAGETLDAVAEISRKVEGLPLAIELASTWTRSLTVAQLLTELDKSFDVLSSQQRDLPERHRSLRNVFSYSWQRLNQKEQDALVKMSIFQSGFTLAAAEEVAGAHLALLLSLINHSVIRRSNSGRFDMHPLVRQYLMERLTQVPEVYVQLKDLHGNYYLTLLSQYADGKDQSKLTLLRQDDDNIRLAWFHAQDLRHADLIKKSLQAYTHFLMNSGYLQEGHDAFTQMLEAILPKRDTLPELFVKIQARIAVFCINLGDFTKSKTLFEDSLQRSQDEVEKAHIISQLARIATSQGSYAEAHKQLLSALEIYKNTKDLNGQASTLTNLGVNANSVGDDEDAKTYYAQASTLYEQLGNKLAKAHVNKSLGIVFSNSGEFAKAKQVLEDCLVQFEGLGNEHSIATTKSNLGYVFGQLGEHQRQLEAYQAALKIFESLKDPLWIAFETFHIGQAKLALNNLLEAEQCFKNALSRAMKIKVPPIALKVLTGFASLADVSKAAELLWIVIEHPATIHSHREQAKEQLADLRLNQSQKEKARASAESLDLETLTAELLA